jgi:hypothetical protein
MARLKKRASKGSEKTTMYDKKINGRDKAKAMAKSKSKRVVESDSGADQREGGQGGRRLRLTREMKMAKEMIDNFNPPKRAEDCKPSLAAFLVYLQNNVVEGQICPALYDEGFQYYHRHFGSNLFKINKPTTNRRLQTAGKDLHRLRPVYFRQRCCDDGASSPHGLLFPGVLSVPQRVEVIFERVTKATKQG